MVHSFVLKMPCWQMLHAKLHCCASCRLSSTLYATWLAHFCRSMQNRLSAWLTSISWHDCHIHCYRSVRDLKSTGTSTLCPFPVEIIVWHVKDVQNGLPSDFGTLAMYRVQNGVPKVVTQNRLISWCQTYWLWNNLFTEVVRCIVCDVCVLWFVWTRWFLLFRGRLAGNGPETEWLLCSTGCSSYRWYWWWYWCVGLVLVVLQFVTRLSLSNQVTLLCIGMLLLYWKKHFVSVHLMPSSDCYLFVFIQY